MLVLSRKFGFVFVSVWLMLSSACIAEPRIVVLSSLERALQNDTSVQGAESAEVFCARGETESFQIVVVNAGATEIQNVDLELNSWEPLRGPGELPKATLFREFYVPIMQPSPRSGGKAGWYPDALIPFVHPYAEGNQRISEAKYKAAGMSIAPRTNQGYWVDVRVDRDVPGGTYTSSITVKSNGQVIADVPVHVIVWDFALPEIPQLQTYFGNLRDVCDYHGVSKSSPLHPLMESRYTEMLRDHGVKLRFQQLPSIRYRTGDVTFTSDFVRRLREYTETYHPSITRVEAYFADEPENLKRYLTAWELFLQQNRWIPQPIVYMEEPSTREDYQKIIDYGRAIDRYAPSIQFFVAEQIEPEKPNYPSLAGAVDIWCPVWFHANPERIRERQLAGDVAWSYVHGDPAGVPGWLIDFPLLNYRIPAWFSWSMDLKGLHYWMTHAWVHPSRPKDPWTNPSTGTRERFSYGEGSLLYPGTQAGIAGPVASIRLKVLRDGIEDYDYFYLLGLAQGPQSVRSMTEPIAATMWRYSRDAEQYLVIRKKMAQLILGEHLE